MSEAPGLVSRPPRVALVDAIRGLAIVGVVLYHLTWNLGAFGLAPESWSMGPVGRLIAAILAWTFVTLVGVSLVLACRGGLNRRAYGVRLGKVGGGALAISVVTYLATPEVWIFFGILHLIFVGSIVGLLFVRVPWWATAAVAFLVLFTPQFVDLPALSDARATAWLGLGPVRFATSDFEPFFPWFAGVLLGIVAAHLVLQGKPAQWLSRWKGQGALGRFWRWCGRRSLAIYLIHQPVLYGACWAVASLR